MTNVHEKIGQEMEREVSDDGVPQLPSISSILRNIRIESPSLEDEASRNAGLLRRVVSSGEGLAEQQHQFQQADPQQQQIPSLQQMFGQQQQLPATSNHQFYLHQQQQQQQQQGSPSESDLYLAQNHPQRASSAKKPLPRRRMMSYVPQGPATPTSPSDQNLGQHPFSPFSLTSSPPVPISSPTKPKQPLFVSTKGYFEYPAMETPTTSLPTSHSSPHELRQQHHHQHLQQQQQQLHLRSLPNSNSSGNVEQPQQQFVHLQPTTLSPGGGGGNTFSSPPFLSSSLSRRSSFENTVRTGNQAFLPPASSSSSSTNATPRKAGSSITRRSPYYHDQLNSFKQQQQESSPGTTPVFFPSSSSPSSSRPLSSTVSSAPLRAVPTSCGGNPRVHFIPPSPNFDRHQRVKGTLPPSASAEPSIFHQSQSSPLSSPHQPPIAFSSSKSLPHLSSRNSPSHLPSNGKGSGSFTNFQRSYADSSFSPSYSSSESPSESPFMSPSLLPSSSASPTPSGSSPFRQPTTPPFHHPNSPSFHHQPASPLSSPPARLTTSSSDDLGFGIIVPQARKRKKQDERKKKGLWKDEDMEKAIQMVRDGKASARGAAVQCNVPRSTLWDRLVGRVTHGVDRRRKKIKTTTPTTKQNEPSPTRLAYSCGMWVPKENSEISLPEDERKTHPDDPDDDDDASGGEVQMEDEKKEEEKTSAGEEQQGGGGCGQLSNEEEDSSSSSDPPTPSDD